MMKLYTYYRSSAAFRVRIALNLKGLDYQSIPIHLLKDGGQHKQPDYLAINPQGLVPALIDDDQRFSQSLAIIDYLDEQYPQPPLLPENIKDKANVRAFAYAIATDIHPLNNLRVLRYLEQELTVSARQKQAWYHHWLKPGFDALQQLLENQTSFCFGELPGLADCCLIPQIYNALRFDYPMAEHPQLDAIYQHALQQPAFADALPENQPDQD